MKKLLLLVGLVVFLTTFETNADKPNIYFCEMHQFAEVGRDKIKEYELEKFRFERFEENKIVFKDEIFKFFTWADDGEYNIDFYQNFEPNYNKEYFFGSRPQTFFEYNDNQFTFSYVDQFKQPTTIINIIGTCEKF